MGSCAGLMRQLWKLGTLLFSTMCTVVTALIPSRLDYSNAVYTGLPDKLVGKLQVVLNDAARLILKLPTRAHATPLLQRLHWLPIKQSARFKGLCIAHKAHHGLVPNYIEDSLKPYVPGRGLRSSEASLLACRHLIDLWGGGALSQLGFPSFGTRYWIVCAGKPP